MPPQPFAASRHWCRHATPRASILWFLPGCHWSAASFTPIDWSFSLFSTLLISRILIAINIAINYFDIIDDIGATFTTPTAGCRRQQAAEGRQPLHRILIRFIGRGLFAPLKIIDKETRRQPATPFTAMPQPAFAAIRQPPPASLRQAAYQTAAIFAPHYADYYKATTLYWHFHIDKYFHYHWIIAAIFSSEPARGHWVITYQRAPIIIEYAIGIRMYFSSRTPSFTDITIGHINSHNNNIGHCHLANSHCTQTITFNSLSLLLVIE